mgnify:CR=1 FL=1
MRLVDADDLLAEYDRQHEGEPGKARKLIEDAPTIDRPTRSQFKRMAVQLGYEPVVHCKDCKNSWEDIGGLCCSHGVCVDCTVPEDFFCADGERKENDGA